MMRRRDAPSDNLIPISRWRATARASSRLATFAQAIIRMSPNAKKIGEKNAITSSQSAETVPCRGSSVMDTGRPPTVFGFVRAAHTSSPAVACSRDTPGFSRPTTVTGLSASPPASVGRNSPASVSGAQKSGGATFRPRKLSGITPTATHGTPLIRTLRPTIVGSPANCFIQAL